MGALSTMRSATTHGSLVVDLVSGRQVRLHFRVPTTTETLEAGATAVHGLAAAAAAMADEAHRVADARAAERRAQGRPPLPVEPPKKPTEDELADHADHVIALVCASVWGASEVAAADADGVVPDGQIEPLALSRYRPADDAPLDLVWIGAVRRPSITAVASMVIELGGRGKILRFFREEP